MIKEMALKAKLASRVLSLVSAKDKNKVLLEMAKRLESNQKQIISENKKDLLFAEKAGLSSAMLDRLTLTPERILKMAEGVAQVAKLEDPVGKTLEKWTRPNGLKISKVSVPIGLVGMIYESRPNVTADAASLCLKSGNACILRGGKEAINSNKVIVDLLQQALKKSKLPKECITFINKIDRKLVDEMLQLSGIIDVIIPRGGKSLVKKITEVSKIPVIKHYDGNCHIYIDEFADLKKAFEICLNAKVQKPGVCNAAETFLIHQKIAAKFLPILANELKLFNVQIKGCSKTRKLIKAEIATEQDWFEEYLDLIVAIKIVKDISEAMNHINHYGSMHTDCIISRDKKNLKLFEEVVDSAVVVSNASTRFNDGFEFGFGAEIGISTDRLHARGPVGLRELTTYKYIVQGNGQVRV